MATKRRRCRLSNPEYRNIDLKNYEQIIVDTINTTVPGKNPKVYHSCFTTDVLTQSEAVSLGRALAKVDELSQFGREVTIFRLFDGKTYDSEDKINLSNSSKECDHVTGIHTNDSKKKRKPKGGRRS